MRCGFSIGFLSVLMKLFTVTCTILPLIELIKLLSFFVPNGSVANILSSCLKFSSNTFSSPLRIDLSRLFSYGFLSLDYLNRVMVDVI